MVKTRFSNPASAVVVTTQESVRSESRHKFSVLLCNNDASSLAATTHDRTFGGVIGDLDAKNIQKLDALWTSDYHPSVDKIFCEIMPYLPNLKPSKCLI